MEFTNSEKISEAVWEEKAKREAGANHDCHHISLIYRQGWLLYVIRNLILA